MKEFKFSTKYFLLSGLSIVIAFVIIIAFKNSFYTSILAILISIGIYSIFKTSFTSYIIDDVKLLKKTYNKSKEVLYWNDINKVVRLANIKDGVMFLGKDKKFIVSSTIGNYKEMRKLMIEKCKNNKDIFIDPKILENM